MAMQHPQEVQLQQDLIQWFGEVQRPLPWRKDRTVYGTWISEIMLQQTTVATVIPYWNRFMEKFPSVDLLAAAPLAEVLSLWSGLGYYRRARHLHQAARIIADQGGGFPETREQWAELPGVGAYASGAIASLTAGQRVPAVDANARRVISRWHWSDPQVFQQITPRTVEKVAEGLVPAESPGLWNEAVMELGAMVCGARQARCDQCPVLDHCQAGLAGTAMEIPAPARRTELVPVRAGLVLITLGSKIWLTCASATPQALFPGCGAPAREDFSGLHLGLWSLPSTPWYHAHEVGDQNTLELGGRLLERLQVAVPSFKEGRSLKLAEVGRLNHAITHYKMEVSVHRLDLGHLLKPDGRAKDIDPPGSGDYYKTKEILNQVSKPDNEGFFTENVDKLPLSGLARKALKCLDDNIC